MTFALSAERNNLPVFSRTSSFTRLAGGHNDPYQAVKQDRDVEQLALYSLRRSIIGLSSLPENWDGFGSLSPNLDAIGKALDLVEGIYDSALATGSPWVKPHVTSSEDGDVVLEWWNGAHKLTLYIGNGPCEFVQVWGPDINTQMRHGTLVGEQFNGLWLWLFA